MATEPLLAALDVSVAQGRRIASFHVLFDYWKLTKPEINFLIAITTAAGFWIGLPAASPHFPWMPFIHMLLGTVFVAAQSEGWSFCRLEGSCPRSRKWKSFVKAAEHGC